MVNESVSQTATRLNEIRCGGNKFFAKKDYTEAITSYTRCVSECLKALDFPCSEREVSKELKEKLAVDGPVEAAVNVLRDICNTLVLAWSNRAEAFLRLKKYDSALQDARKAVELDPTNLKSLNRKGKSLEALHQYEEANACFLAAFKLAPQDPDIRESMKRTKICSLQGSPQGEYDLSQFYLDGCKGVFGPCSDHVGPVEIRRTSSGGRGLFATRRVAAGELLLVSNALAIAPILPEPSITGESGIAGFEMRLVFRSREHEAKHLITKLAKVAQACPRSRHQLLALTHMDSDRDMAIPSMDLFRPGGDWMDSQSEELDIGRIRGISHFSNYNLYGHLADITEYYNPRQQKRTGVWGLPSFLAHSCFANCLRMHIGKAMFVRAMRDIPAGKLLTIDWFDVLDPLKARQESSRNWGFRCKCCRCVFEEGLAPLQKIGRRFFELVHLIQVKHQDLSAEMANLLPEVEEFIRSRDELESKHKNWIRASCIYAYIAQVAQLGSDLEHKIPLLEMVVESMTSVSAAGMFGLQYAAQLLRDVGTYYGSSSEHYFATERRVTDIFRIAYGTSDKKALLTLIHNFQKVSETTISN